jgi:ribonuclease BN (tRNA processing enzyme)
MKLIVLGSGTCVPSLQRNAPGYYLEAEGCQVLVDCGSGTLLQLEKTGRSYKDIDAVFITHKHPDHFADLMPFLQALVATPRFRRTKDLFISGPKDFMEYYEASIVSVLGTPKEFSLITVEAIGEQDFGPFHITTAKTVHASDSISYRFEHKGTSVVYTGDADYDEGLIAHARDADLFITDCSFPDSEKSKGHLSAKECGIIAQKAGVKKLMLSHLYPSELPDEDRVKESSEVFSGDIVLAEDLMEMDI